VKAELAALEPQARDGSNAGQAAALLNNLGTLWDQATAEQRRKIAASLFTEVYCDLDGKRVVAVKLKRAFLPLRNALPTHTATNPAEATSACTSDEAECTECGTDGHRIRGCDLTASLYHTGTQAPGQSSHGPRCRRG